MMITRQLRNSAIFVAFTGLILAAAVSLEGALAWTTFRPHPRRSATATASRRTDPAPLSPTRPCVTQAISSSSLFRSSPASSSNWRPSLVTLHAAAPSSGGFGKSKAAGGKKKTASSSSSTSGSNAESSKLKPKQQWDRYMELKGCPKIKVGIRATNKKGDGSAADWLEVGHVKFQEDVGAQVAVARQRALIAEVRASTWTRNLLPRVLSDTGTPELTPVCCPPIDRTARQAVVPAAGFPQGHARVGISKG